MTSATSMINQNHHRHQLIKNLTAQQSEKAADTTIMVWEQMSTNIVSLIGERGFKSLYVRSILINMPKFHWLETYDAKSETNNQFIELKRCLEIQMPDQIKIFNNQLLVTLTDILASLIGEGITINILCLAWSDQAPNLVTKDLTNE